jgi:hypothetical protein
LKFTNPEKQAQSGGEDQGKKLEREKQVAPNMKKQLRHFF